MKGIIESLVGKDINGERLTAWERVLGAVPLASRVRQIARMLGGVDAATDVLRSIDRLGEPGAVVRAGPDEAVRAAPASPVGQPLRSRLGRNDLIAPDNVWHADPTTRGRRIQDFLAESDYRDWIETDKLVGGGNTYPLIDFVSPDGRYSVSVKTLDTSTRSFAVRDNTLESLADHAPELADHAYGKTVTLDLRVFPGTPPELVQRLQEDLTDIIGEPDRFTAVVRVFP